MVSPVKVAAFVCLLVCLCSIALAQPQRSVADKIVAVVGDEIILRSDVQNWLEDLRRQGNPVLDSTQCMVVKNIVESKILLLQALKDSITVSEEEVEETLNLQLSSFDYNFSDDIRKKLKFFDLIKERKLIYLMQEKILSKVKITPTEVKQFYKSIPANQFPFLETQYEVGQIIAYPKASPEMQQYIISEMNNYKKQVETKVATFDQLAKRYSEDPGSKDRGGQYQVNRNEKSWDPVFLSTAFRLKEGEISAPVKSKFGFHIIQMVERNGDNAVVKHILRIPPVAEKEIKEAVFNLNTIRAEVKLGEVSFKEAAKKHGEDEQAVFSSFFQNRNGESFLTADELPQDLAKQIFPLKTGEISEAKSFIDEEGRQAVRIVYLKSKIEAHRMNLTDDYSRLAQLALDNKKKVVLASWLKTKITNFHITIEEDILAKCGELRKYNN